MVKPQTTIGRMMMATAIVAILLTVGPLVYNSSADGWGNSFSLVMISVSLIGGLVGLMIGGVESMFAGFIVGFVLFLTSGFIVMLIWTGIRIL